ncbi:MAG: hypothetical protein V2B20_08805 [Pseudomonadota bacterium]
MKEQGNTWLSMPLRMPWWGSILMAIAVYCGLKYGIPALHPVSPALQQFFQAAPSFAPILTIPWLLLAGKQLYDTDLPGDEEEIPAPKDQETKKE